MSSHSERQWLLGRRDEGGRFCSSQWQQFSRRYARLCHATGYSCALFSLLSFFFLSSFVFPFLSFCTVSSPAARVLVASHMVCRGARCLRWHGPQIDDSSASHRTLGRNLQIKGRRRCFNELMEPHTTRLGKERSRRHTHSRHDRPINHGLADQEEYSCCCLSLSLAALSPHLRPLSIILTTSFRGDGRPSADVTERKATGVRKKSVQIIHYLTSADEHVKRKFVLR